MSLMKGADGNIEEEADNFVEEEETKADEVGVRGFVVGGIDGLNIGKEKIILEGNAFGDMRGESERKIFFLNE